MTLFALLVGIDAYRSPVSPLRGAVNDVVAMTRILEQRSGGAFSACTLLDGAATRDAVVAGIREHLGRAGAGDTALFYYAGHGSQEPCPPEYRHLEPDLLNETLVLVDSRTGGGRDLADKELAALLAGVATGGAHVVVILDCCHSGSGTRDAVEAGATVRRTAIDVRERAADTYLGDLRDVPDPPHVLLAACRDNQTAKETVVNGVVRGAFSAMLQRILGDPAVDLTYEEIIRWAAAGVRNRARNQTPVLETGGGVDGALLFLGGVRAGAGPLLTASFRRYRGWVLDAGLVHGIHDPAAAVGDTEVELFAMTGGAPRVAAGRVRRVGTVDADLDLACEPDPDVTYRVELVRVATPAVTVVLAVGAGERAALCDRLDRVPWVRVVPDPAAAAVRIVRTGNLLRLIRPAARRPVVAAFAAAEPSTVDDVVAAVAHVARWLTLADRHRPAGTVAKEAAGVELVPVDGAPVDDGPDCVRVRYRRSGDAWVQPCVRIRIVNRSAHRWFYALVVLSESYGVASLLPGGGTWLDPGAECWVLTAGNSPEWYLSVPPDEVRSVDVFKLVVSGAEFDARQWRQPDLPDPRQPDRAGAAERSLGELPQVPAGGADWLVVDTVVVTERLAAAERPDRTGAAGGRS